MNRLVKGRKKRKGTRNHQLPANVRDSIVKLRNVVVRQKEERKVLEKENKELVEKHNNLAKQFNTLGENRIEILTCLKAMTKRTWWQVLRKKEIPEDLKHCLK